MNTITIHCAGATHQHQLAIQLLFHGREDCEPGHFWGPGLRDSYILHIVQRGRGTFHGKDQSYTLSRGQGFLVMPDRIVHYEADQEDPWSYCWIGFQGLQVKTMLQAAHISEHKPVFNFHNEELIDHLHQNLVDASKLKGYDLMLQSIMYRVFSELVESSDNYSHQVIQSTTEHYIEQAKEWINHNYSQKIMLSQVAQHVGLNSSYLSRLFKARYGLSLQEYIMTYRMNRAIELLNNTKLTISEVSRSVGYPDPFVFSKIFKKTTGKAPSVFRIDTHHIEYE